jgi:hypothetical protein
LRKERVELGEERRSAERLIDSSAFESYNLFIGEERLFPSLELTSLLLLFFKAQTSVFTLSLRDPIPDLL